jgi:ethanolamine utilization cobalamin adenosyltransferase
VREVEEKIFKLKDECAAYTEHDTPDGKKYYYNAKTNQSVWEKPKCLSDMTGNFLCIQNVSKIKIFFLYRLFFFIINYRTKR